MPPPCRPLLAAIAAMTLVTGASAGQPAPAAEWPRASLAEAGFAADLGERIDARVADGSFQNLHGVLVTRGGKLVLERYYKGEDQAWGRPLGRVAFGPETLHDLRSVTKSVVGLVYGIALREGLVPALDASLVEQFPEHRELAAEPRRRRMTVAHALSMTLGTEWDEGLSYADPRNSEHAMELAAGSAGGRVRYVLDRPMIAEPGARWIYNGGATAVLGRLIARGSGRPLADYARERLLAPLGIESFEWVVGRDGAHIAASGLRLRPRDLAKIGQLVLNRGRWEGRELVPADWLARSFQAHAETETLHYGYHWWLGPPVRQGRVWVAGFGNGGQRLSIAPGLELVVAVLAGNYNKPDAWQLPVAILTEIVLPGLEWR